MTRALARGETLEWYPNWHVIIDRPLMDARMLGWAMWKYHLSGLFLWHTANGWDKAAKIYQAPRSVYSDGRLIWGLGLLVYPDENFNPCSSLRLEAVSFESLRPGDIVAVESAPVPYVHRVIRVNGTEAVTQGDNNAAPDARPLTPGCRFSLVTGAVSFPGVFRPVAGGPQGMRRFRRNQWRRKLRAGAGRVWHRLEPRAFWRIPVRSRTVFRNEMVFDFHGIPVARVSANGSVHYFGSLKRLLFRLPGADRSAP